MSAIGNAFKALGDGIKGAFEGAGRLIKGALTLDLKGALQGASQMINGALTAADAAARLHPQALCANLLLDRAVTTLQHSLQHGQRPQTPGR